MAYNTAGNLVQQSLLRQPLSPLTSGKVLPVLFTEVDKVPNLIEGFYRKFGDIEKNAVVIFAELDSGFLDNPEDLLLLYWRKTPDVI